MLKRKKIDLHIKKQLKRVVHTSHRTYQSEVQAVIFKKKEEGKNG
jgi:hypothetical protein